MVFNQEFLSFIFWSGVVSWLTAITIFVWRTARHYNRLTAGNSKINLKAILESLLNNQGRLQSKLTNVEKECKDLRMEIKGNIQQVGLVRFNPFADTGGSQSFTLALLDGENNGVVMTSLYGRTANRWYAKVVESGKGKDVALSREEETAIKEARHIRHL